jgi:hypothetical protein
MAEMKQKVFLVTDSIVHTTGVIFKKHTFEKVYRVKKALNYTPDKFYRPEEVDELIENGIEVEIVQ